VSTLQDVIDDGWRELNLIALGTSANTAQTAEGVRLLNHLRRGKCAIPRVIDTGTLR
jgi:hypothetical protein